jgi:hypothetical protein
MTSHMGFFYASLIHVNCKWLIVGRYRLMRLTSGLPVFRTFRLLTSGLRLPPSFSTKPRPYYIFGPFSPIFALPKTQFK